MGLFAFALHMSGAGHRCVLSRFLLARFADGLGQVMAERRDRGRRALRSVDQAAAEAGVYEIVPERIGSRELSRLLDRTDARVANVIDQMVSGVFPPQGEDRSYLALFLSIQLLLSRHHRAEVSQAVGWLTHVVAAALENAEAADTEGSGDRSVVPASREAHRAGESDVILHGTPPIRVSLAQAPRLARSLAARTWQLVRFPERRLLTGDTPVVLWSRPGSRKPYQVGLGSADEVRLPLDPRHALIMARRAQLGEIVRDLGDRHARALNRAVAEAASEWIYYHPESDPLEGVELPSAELPG